ncbi:hypothetical protein [Knoellia subterranea]|uniref:Uncharacterized protein n=1 Tax=Knoellia subterranea KCTC 19937 TaxID=1385521 RepID=A0A0A0JG46_9MICO|nr:hypothetical protein [Knoellia subterranea]KGN36098.1 hypothetical protein N803_09370 [Knoellia subterranea KCTC 19937]
MTRLASAIVALGVRVLPRQDRRRYGEELDADLRSQPGWRRLGYAVSFLLATPRLRWELLARHAGQPVPNCFVGMHRDRDTHPNREASWVIVRECVRCRRLTDPPQYEPRRRVNDIRAWYSANGGR